MKKIAPILALIVALGLLAGCQKAADEANSGSTTVAKKDEPEKAKANATNPVGKYELVLPEVVKSNVDEAKAKGNLPKDAQYPEMSFTLKSDGTAEMSYSEPSPSGVQRGTGKATWKADGDKIIITPTERDGQPISNPEEAKPFALVWNTNKTMLESEEPVGPNGEKMQFKKVA